LCDRLADTQFRFGAHRIVPLATSRGWLKGRTSPDLLHLDRTDGGKQRFRQYDTKRGSI
jgi:hypothetical protein